jgi:hypothetical protein
MTDAPEWVPLEATAWVEGVATLDRDTEFVFWRMCLKAYAKGNADVTGTTRGLAAFCKVDADLFTECMAVLVEEGKCEVIEGGWHMIKCGKVLDDSRKRMSEAADKTAKGRAILSIMRKENVSKSEARKLYALSQSEKNTVTDAQETVTDEKPSTVHNSTSTYGRTSRKRGSRLKPEMIDRTNWIKWAVENHDINQGAAEGEIDRFENYWIAADGKSAVKLDWFRTWQNWISRAHDKRSGEAPKPAEMISVPFGSLAYAAMTDWLEVNQTPANQSYYKIFKFNRDKAAVAYPASKWPDHIDKPD